MIGIALVGHSNIGKEFLEVIEHIVGKQEKLFAYQFIQLMIWR